MVNIRKNLLFLAVISFLFSSHSTLASPPPNPPNNNTPLPIYIDNSYQIKDGRLELGNGFNPGSPCWPDCTGLKVLNGSVGIGIGTNTPSQLLHSSNFVRTDSGFYIGSSLKSAWIDSVSGATGLGGSGSQGAITISFSNPNQSCPANKYMTGFNLTNNSPNCFYPPPGNVTTDPATNISYNNATLNGSAKPRNAPTTGWFRYSTSNPGNCNNTFGTATAPINLGAGSSPISYSDTAFGLTPLTTYYFCAIAGNSDVTAPGSPVRNFTTLAYAQANYYTESTYYSESTYYNQGGYGYNQGGYGYNQGGYGYNQGGYGGGGASAVTLYEHTNYQGRSISFNCCTDIPSLLDAFCSGCNSGNNWNDVASSMGVASGQTITLYQNINYGGTSQTFTGGFYPNFVDLGINDWASSIKFGPAPPPPPPSNYNLNVNSSGYSGISVSSSTGHSGTTNYTKSVSSGANVNLRSLIGVINVQGGNNHYFTSWSGSSACLDTNYEITFSMPASNTTCTTNFVSTCGNLSLYNSNNLGGGCEGYSDSWSFINGGKNSGATKNNFTAFVFPNANFSGGYWKITQNSTLRFPSNSIYSAIVSGSGPDEVRVTTGTDNGAGTDDRVYLKVYNVETGWRYIHLDKNGDDFENGNVDTYTTSNNTNGDPVVIGPGDTHFRMYKSPDGTSFGDWKLQHWSATDNGQVIINDSHNGWLNDQTTQTPERVRCYHSIGGPGTTC